MSDRHLRVESLIRELVANFIQQEANTDPLITVTRTSTAPDYRRVTIFFTTIPDGKEEGGLSFSGSAQVAKFVATLRRRVI